MCEVKDKGKNCCLISSDDDDEEEKGYTTDG